MDSSTTTIVWFRRDLRIEDNPALSAAAKDGCVFPVYIWCPEEEGQFYPGRASRWWLKQSISHLGQSLKSLGVELKLIRANSTIDALLDIIHATGASKVVFNHLYDPVSIVRDHDIKQKLAEQNIDVKSYNGDLLFEPWEVYDENGLAFTRFDPYWEKCLTIQMNAALHCAPWQLVPAQASGKLQECTIEQLGLEKGSEKSSNDLLGRAWSPGWSNANKALAEFVEQNLCEYTKNRARVGGNSTSLLSPYLHYGELSVRKVFQSVQIKQILWAKEGNSPGLESINVFLRAIGLREYSRYLCFNFPFTHERSLLSKLRNFPWNSDQTVFKAWRLGRTGYPLVDAAMRELWATGWMHNRLRVIASSFCVKVLLLPWRWGMKYFWDTLLDADLECDILGWQYISGSLPDSHDLHRLDDPEVQGSKFDPEGEYIRLWLPELARVPTEWIHHPWHAPPAVLRAAGVELGVNYPNPIIDIETARDSLRDAIFLMQEKAGCGPQGTGNGSKEEVFDNSDNVGTSDIPKVVLRGKAVVDCSSVSSRDQRVPSMQNMSNLPNNRKRPKPGDEEENNRAGYKTGVTEADVCSTADSGSNKKPAMSRTSFCVPNSCSVSTYGNPDKNTDMEGESSAKDGVGLDFHRLSKHLEQWKLDGEAASMQQNIRPIMRFRAMLFVILRCVASLEHSASLFWASLELAPVSATLALPFLERACEHECVPSSEWP
ncbi:hypothetical protein V2J09_006029 [Rumex salicifolius]